LKILQEGDPEDIVNNIILKKLMSKGSLKPKKTSKVTLKKRKKRSIKPKATKKKIKK
jgi:hypothetical protein